jgi:hypothetical protein
MATLTARTLSGASRSIDRGAIDRLAAGLSHPPILAGEAEYAEARKVFNSMDKRPALGRRHRCARPFPLSSPTGGMIDDSARIQDDAAVRPPPQKVGPNQRIDNTLTRGWIQAQQAGRLGRGQPKSWHLVEFRPDAPHQLGKVHRALHSTASYSRRNADTEGKSRATTGRTCCVGFSSRFRQFWSFHSPRKRNHSRRRARRVGT